MAILGTQAFPIPYDVSALPGPGMTSRTTTSAAGLILNAFNTLLEGGA
jgi:hypothetical protein